MRVAFTLDDIPLWPRSHPPDCYSVASIMQKISDALVRNGIHDVYDFGNSWSLVQHPELATVLDAWVAAGHHVGNHTHSHPVLTEIGWERYCGEIDLADRHLAPWLSKAPNRFFRYTLCQGVTPRRNAPRCWRISPLRTTSQPMFQAGGTNGTGIELGATPEIAPIPKP